MRKAARLVLACALVLALSVAVLPPPVMAKTITVDGDPSDWSFGFLPYNINTGHVKRDTGSPAPGEYAWKDNSPDHTNGSADERTDFVMGVQDPRVDLSQFRVTGDATNIYFLACMTDIPAGATSGAGAPQVQVAIDTNQDASGVPNFLANADTNTHPNAGWETLLITRFGSGQSNVRTWAAPPVTPTDTGVAAISDVHDCIEFSVPWVQLGLSGVPSGKPLRFTVAIFRADANDDTQDISGTSDALDAVTNYGIPCDLSNTWAEVSDGVIDYYFDVYFQPGSGEVMSPLLISEVYPNPAGTEPDEEWVQIYNAWGTMLTLDFWKLGDEESCTQKAEGMHQFPNGQFLASGATAVIANSNTAFVALGYSGCVGGAADYEIQNTNGTPDMTRYTAWAANDMALNNTSEQIMLLDGSNTVMDGVMYGTASLPGHTSFGSAPPEGNSMERSPVNRDTNDCSLDFLLAGNGGTPCDSPTAVILHNLAASEGRGWRLLAGGMGLAVVLAGGVVLSRRRRR